MNSHRSTALLWCTLAACTVGPKYERPAAESPPSYKELTPEQRKTTAGWKNAEPKDDVLHGRWWEIFGDPLLNHLEEQVEISNQNIAASFAGFMSARAMVREARAGYYPTVSVAPGVTTQHGLVTSSANTGASSGSTGGQTTTGGSTSSGSIASTSSTITELVLPVEASWAPDLWGKVRRQVESNVALAQASAADLENVKLTAQAELATDYFQLRGQDALQKVLNESVDAQRKSLELTQNLFKTGIGADAAVAQADAQLQTTLAQAIDVQVNRATYEHAIAVLLGQPPQTFSIPVDDWKAQPVAIPYGVPSQLLERRPDIAAAERNMASVNAQIGLAIAAYYPSLDLSASAGLGSAALGTVFSAPTFFWSLGASLTQLVFDGGLRSATVDQYRAAYDQAVANYRQTVLTAFQQVEDNLSTLRILSSETEQQVKAVQASQKSYDIEMQRYKLGLDPYLNVITAQLTLLGNQQTDVTLKTRQIVSSVALIEALGGGWDASQLPNEKAASAPPEAKAHESP